MVFYIQIIYNLIKNIIYKLLNKFRTLRLFHIGFSKGHFNLDLKTFMTIPNQENSYYADPFLLHKDSSTYIFCEKYSYTERKGSINLFELSENLNLVDLGTVINEGFHLSFPYVFQFENQIFMIPETKSLGQIVLYRNVEWPLKWEKFHVLIENICAVDTVIFHKNGIWWLLTSMDSANTNIAQSELHIFYSQNLVGNTWKPHKNNPVVVNSYYGRNAGLFFTNNKIIRCSQSYKDFVYGNSLNMHEIVEIDENSYVEKIIQKDILKNSHTYSTTSNITVIDYRI